MKRSASKSFPEMPIDPEVSDLDEELGLIKTQMSAHPKGTFVSLQEGGPMGMYAATQFGTTEQQGLAESYNDVIDRARGHASVGNGLTERLSNATEDEFTLE